METKVQNLEEMHAEATRFLGGLHKKEDGAMLITLSGELGAGKTAFVKMIAQELGVDDLVTSPTFVLEKIYSLGGPTSKFAQFARLIHIDAYRLEDGKDLSAIGFDEILQDPDNLIFLEWPEKVENNLPKTAHKISIKVLSDDSRLISYD